MEKQNNIYKVLIIVNDFFNEGNGWFNDNIHTLTQLTN